MSETKMDAKERVPLDFSLGGPICEICDQPLCLYCGFCRVAHRAKDGVGVSQATGEVFCESYVPANMPNPHPPVIDTTIEETRQMSDEQVVRAALKDDVTASRWPGNGLFCIEHWTGMRATLLAANKDETTAWKDARKASVVAEYETAAARLTHPEAEPAEAVQDRIYPCADCGKMRFKAEGGTVFTVCDTCWDKAHTKPESPHATRVTEIKGDFTDPAGRKFDTLRITESPKAEGEKEEAREADIASRSDTKPEVAAATSKGDGGMKCDICDGVGSVDSGGFTPWGEGIEVKCGRCDGTGEVESVWPIESPQSARNLAKILSQKPQGEPGTRTNPLKAEGTINEIATRVMDGTWTTLDLEALADYALQSQPSSLAGTFEEAWRKRFPHAEVKPASVDDFAKGIAREFWNAALKSKQSQPVIEPMVSDAEIAQLINNINDFDGVHEVVECLKELQQFRKAQQERMR